MNLPLSPPEPLSDGHQVDNFHSGEPGLLNHRRHNGADRRRLVESIVGGSALCQLDDWLRRRARANQASGASRTYVACDRMAVIAYYALASGAIAQAAVPGRFRRDMPDPIPVVVPARLAVDRSYQGRGIGRALFRDAASRVSHAADVIGIRGILVHAISEEARKFYIALGFDPCPAEAMTLVVTLQDLRASLETS